MKNPEERLPRFVNNFFLSGIFHVTCARFEGNLRCDRISRRQQSKLDYGKVIARSN